MARNIVARIARRYARTLIAEDYNALSFYQALKGMIDPFFHRYFEEVTLGEDKVVSEYKNHVKIEIFDDGGGRVRAAIGPLFHKSKKYFKNEGGWYLSPEDLYEAWERVANRI